MTIDYKIPFKTVNIAVLTISDTRIVETDISGNLLIEKISEIGHILVKRKIVEDDIVNILDVLNSWVFNENIDVIITTGGTGLTEKDVTPEAVKNFFEKSIDGFGEMFRWISFEKIGTSALQSRATAGVKNGKYIFCLPGSPSACRDGWEKILKFQLDIRHKPCNFIEMIPRLKLAKNK